MKQQAAITILLVQLLSLGVAGARAQDTGSATDLSEALDLRYQEFSAPDSPAMILLNQDVTSIQRPVDPKDFALTFLQEAGEGLNADSFGLELAPYWLFGGDMLTYEEDLDRSLGESVLRNLTLSIARSELDSETNRTGLAFGLRTSLLSGKPREDASTVAGAQSLLAEMGRLQLEHARQGAAVRALADTVAMAQAAMKNVLAEIVALEEDDIDDSAQAAEFGVLEEKYETLAENVVEQVRRRKAAETEFMKEFEQSSGYAAKSAELEELLSGLAQDRVGLRLDLAAGAAWGFPDAVAAGGKLDQWGVWLTAAHEIGPCEFMLLGRYQEDIYGDDTTLVWGERLLWQTDKMGLSFEYLQDGDKDHRYAGIIEYMVRSDLWLNLTLGSDFERDAENSLLASLGVKWSLTEARVGVRE